MATILITGGAGFIGSHVAHELVAEGHEVILYDAFLLYASPLEGFYREFLNARLSGPEVVAIGETGLDYHYAFSSRKEQIEAIGG